jgi:hypothetical protein
MIRPLFGTKYAPVITAGRTAMSDMETTMKTTRFVSTIAAGLLAASTACFAQNLGNYAQAYENLQVAPGSSAPDSSRFSRRDFGHQVRRASAPWHETQPKSHAKPLLGEPAPAQESD